jgi:DNA polymerase-4
LRRVDGNRPRKSLGAERTFEKDLSSGHSLREALDNIAELVWAAIEKGQVKGRTVTLKLKYNDFTGLTRARSMPRAVADKAEFLQLGRELLESVLPLPQPVRLMGLTLSALEGAGEPRPHPDDAQLSLL